MSRARRRDWYLGDERHTLRLGASLAAALSAVRRDAGTPGPWTVFLHGQLGAGKTTIVRGMLRALGHPGSVKSPTYTLVEPYELAGLAIYHFDLYRLADPDEVELLGVRDYLAPGALCLVEWPERAGGLWSAPDLDLVLTHDGSGRRARLEPRTPGGERLLAAWPAARHAAAMRAPRRGARRANIRRRGSRLRWR